MIRRSVIRVGLLEGRMALSRRKLPAVPTTRPAEQFVPEAGAEPIPGYRLQRLRGKGAFATVWECTTPTKSLVAMKFMSSANSGGVTSREVRSLQGIQKLSHPALLPIHNVWSMSNYIMIAMPLAEASLLDLFLLYAEEFTSLIELEKLLFLLGQAADAIDYLNKHQHNVDGKLAGYQHSDIKPNNILLQGEQALLADYGLATPMLGSMTPCFRQGTLDYAAPEVFQGTMSDSSDQFSLAVTYYLLRTGSFPFPPPPRSPGRSFYRPPPDLGLVRHEEQKVINRALASAPSDRFPTCAEFIRALAHINGLDIARDIDNQIVRVQKFSSRVGMLTISNRTEPN
jgi:serine/threonine protein kinase, bacterial